MGYRWVHSTKDRLYAVWGSMCRRCNNPNHVSFPYYGGKGVKVCEEWLSYDNFYEWAYENGYNPTAPRGECTLDRIKPNKSYSPDNCRWVTMKEQSRNKSNNIFVDKDTLLTDYAKANGFTNLHTLRTKLKNEGRLTRKRSRRMCDGMTLKEISCRYSIPFVTVDDRWKRGKRTLRELTEPVKTQYKTKSN
jgi:hypothetical protein